MRTMEQKLRERRQRERRRNYASPKVFVFIENQAKLNEKIELALFGNENETGLVKDVKEMREVFNSVGGFKKVSALILKGLIVIGGAIGAFYIIIEFIKNISKGK